MTSIVLFPHSGLAERVLVRPGCLYGAQAVWSLVEARWLPIPHPRGTSEWFDELGRRAEDPGRVLRIVDLCADPRLAPDERVVLATTCDGAAVRAPFFRLVAAALRGFAARHPFACFDGGPSPDLAGQAAALEAAAGRPDFAAAAWIHQDHEEFWTGTARPGETPGSWFVEDALFLADAVAALRDGRWP